jgi:outer membrane protein
MSLEHEEMRKKLARGVIVATAALTVAGTAVSVSAQTAQPTPNPTAAAAEGPVQKITVEEAVRLALENNLRIQVARVDPQIEDMTVAQARAGWTPTFASNIATNSNTQAANSFLAGGIDKINNDQFSGGIGVQQNLRWGGFYSATWDSARSTTSNIFTNFSPQLRSNLALQYVQPLLRNFNIDAIRQQLLVGEKNREIAEIDLQETISNTSRFVRSGYYDLAYAIASLQVQKQSLELAQESLRNNRARVEIGTMAPIDIVEAEAEVAQREEAVILADAEIERAQDALRALIFPYNPERPEFWNVRIEPSELPAFQPIPVDPEGAVRMAFEKRTDLRSTRKLLEANNVSIRYYRNQSMPDINAQVDYGLSGLGGTQFIRGEGFPGPIIGQTRRGYGSVLQDLFNNTYPNWTVSLNIGYPIGTSIAEAGLARARLQYSQYQTQLRDVQLQVATEVRDVARQVVTNQKRVGTTQASRQLAERRLEAEEKKFAAGMSTPFFVFQAQRDLSQARNNELRAILDYNRSIVDYETVQEAPILGTGATTATGTNATNRGAGRFFSTGASPLIGTGTTLTNGTSTRPQQ